MSLFNVFYLYQFRSPLLSFFRLVQGFVEIDDLFQ